MDPERWKRIEDVFHAALERPEAERSDWLKSVCEGDHALQSEVESLLDSDHSPNLPSIRDHVATAVCDAAQSLDKDRFPRKVGPYLLLKEVGRGGMGTVYLAERADGQFEKKVAVKMVQPGLDTEFILTRFRRERQVLANFDHPNIGHLLDGGTTSEGIPYLVMEFIEGDWITRHCDNKHLSIEDRLRVFQQVCSAVHYAHLHFVVHRDLKPGNILVDQNGRPKLLDFGICKLLYREESTGTRTESLGMRLLTPEYASPEQVRGDAVTIASDIYSLGAVLYELLTGFRPHRFSILSPKVVEEVVCEQEIIAPSEIVKDARLASRLRGDLDNILLHAMKKDPSHRYATAELFADDIGRHLAHQVIEARPDTWIYRSRKFARRNRIMIAVSAALVVTFLVGLSSGEIRERLRQKKVAVDFGQHSQYSPNLKGQIARVKLLADLGDSYAEEERWREAQAAYEQAIAILPSDPSLDDHTLSELRIRIRSGVERVQGH